MITKILDISKLTTLLLLLQVGSFSSIYFYETIEDIPGLNFCKGHILSLILSAAFCFSSFLKLNKYSFKNNIIIDLLPEHQYMYYLRFLKNIIVSHALISLYFYKYIEETILYTYSTFLLYGFLMLIYIHVLNLTIASSSSLTTISRVIWILILLILGIIAMLLWLSYEIITYKLNEDFENVKFCIFVILSCIFVLSSIILSFFPKIKDSKLNLYSIAYVFEQLMVASSMYSLQYYNINIKLAIFFVFSFSLYSDKIYNVIINKYLFNEKHN